MNKQKQEVYLCNKTLSNAEAGESFTKGKKYKRHTEGRGRLFRLINNGGRIHGLTSDPQIGWKKHFKLVTK